MEDNKPCNHCGAEPGEVHRDWDDIARCRATGNQLIQCGGELHTYKGIEYGEHEGECGPDIWDGEWPGEKDCRRYGIYTDADSFWGVGPDLNFLAIYGTWDPKTQKTNLPDNYRELHEEYKAKERARRRS